jgi:TolA-binding protein
MKNILILLLCAGSLALNPPVLAQESSIVVSEDSHSVFTGLFRSVWARLKALNPSSRESARSEQVYTVGIRGAESTDTLLKPYWKDDLTQDEAFQAQLKKYSRAQLQMDAGDLETAAKSFDDFLSEFSNSDLRPNALFGKSLCLAATGQTDESRTTLQTFIDENPNHPLIGDARQVMASLN